MLLAVHREFIRLVTRVRTRRRGTRSTNYSASLSEFAALTIAVTHDFAASWRSRATEASSGSSKELWKEGSLMQCEAITDSATIQFSSPKDLIKLSANYPRK